MTYLYTSHTLASLHNRVSSFRPDVLKTPQINPNLGFQGAF